MAGESTIVYSVLFRILTRQASYSFNERIIEGER